MKMGKLLQVIILQIIVFCFAMFQGGFVSWFIFFTVTPFLLYALVMLVWREKIVFVHRTITPAHITRGEDVEVSVHVRRKTVFPIAYAMLEEHVNQPNLQHFRHNTSPIIKIGSFSRNFIWTYELKNLPRGEYRFVGADFYGTDFFGLGKLKATDDSTKSIIVYPKLHPITYVPIQAVFEVGAATTPRSSTSDSTIAVGVRDYEQGDRLSWIHWKSFAKSQQLRTKEFEERQSEVVSVVIDTRHQAQFEDVVELTGSLARTFFEVQGELAYAATDALQQVLHLHHKNHFDDVMHKLANVKPTADASNLRALNTRGFASMLFVTAELTDEDVAIFAHYNCRVICFVLGHNKTQRLAPNVQVQQVTAGNYRKVLQEVTRK